ncbi:MAG: hypothetical protein K9M56_01750 [Victivallales bacterium]|nr:hypothetical protein [Victivallales bacterium]
MEKWKNKYREIFRKNFSKFSFKIFHELMINKVRDILLVSSPYDAFILEEDGRFAEKIIQEYRGMNLTHPPRFTWASTPGEALNYLDKKKFDLVITMPRFEEVNPRRFCSEIKTKHPKLPVYLLSQKRNFDFISTTSNDIEDEFDKKFVWSGNADLLLAIVKSVEDSMNVSHDTAHAKVRVLILVEDSPKYLSSILPLLYKEVVLQTQAVMEDSLNEEDRLLRMRARPKILLAENYEEAIELFNKYRQFLLGVISDIRFKKNGEICDDAGFILHEYITKVSSDTPILLLSSENDNKKKAANRSALFLNKTSPNLHSGIHDFLVVNLAFGSFVFKYPDGRQIARASNIREMEKIIPTIPDESIKYHSSRNHISAWLTARSELFLATLIRAVNLSEFDSINELKTFLAFCINLRRKGHQRGVIADYNSNNFDPETNFLKIGTGSLGGKARGLAFVSSLLHNSPDFRNKFSDIDIRIPKTLVISTEYFDQFIELNSLETTINSDIDDDTLLKKFTEAALPEELKDSLEYYLGQINYPLAVRSSSLLEDSLYQPSAGLYRTYMIPNNNADFNTRLNNLIRTVKEVYASTYSRASKQLSKTTSYKMNEEKMAVIVEEAIGNQYNNYFFPAISGVAQSYNYYSISYMKPEEGIAHIALGFGKTVVEGGQALRFSPKYPKLLPHFSKIEDILKNSQQTFFALNIDNPKKNKTADVSEFLLSKLEIDEHLNEINRHTELRNLFSSYNPQDHKLTDFFSPRTHNVLTFSNILKYNEIPLPEILSEILRIGRRGMGAPVEIEFAVNFCSEDNNSNDRKPEFIILQIRPMTIQVFNSDTVISKDEINKAVCFSCMSMGNGTVSDIEDIVYVDEDKFNPAKTVAIANEISKMNKKLIKDNKKYLLIGPGRWGSADRWLGIPVAWNDISGINAIVETTVESLNASPSQGSHFFHNLCSMGIPYLTIQTGCDSFLDSNWLKSITPEEKTAFLRHIRLKAPVKIKANGKTGNAVIIQQ